MYKSKAQKSKFQQMLKDGKISKEVVSKFDKASEGKALPERIGPKKIKTMADLKAAAKRSK